jgi:hypothetical protein
MTMTCTGGRWWTRGNAGQRTLNPWVRGRVLSTAGIGVPGWLLSALTPGDRTCKSSWAPSRAGHLCRRGSSAPISSARELTGAASDRGLSGGIPAKMTRWLGYPAGRSVTKSRAGPKGLLPLVLPSANVIDDVRSVAVTVACCHTQPIDVSV